MSRYDDMQRTRRPGEQLGAAIHRAVIELLVERGYLSARYPLPEDVYGRALLDALDRAPNADSTSRQKRGS